MKKSKIYIGSRFLKSLKWIKFVPLKKWAEQNVVLTKGAVKGKFKLRNAPHLEFVFDNIDLPHVNTIVIKSASQVQKTTVGLISAMKWINTDYHDILYMIPRAKDIKKFLEFKIKPFLDGCEVVKKQLEDYRQDEKERKNSYFYKTAQNLFAIISSNDTKSITTKYGIFDEVAEFTDGILYEALERMKEYGNTYKAIITSTQIHKNDTINHFFNACEVKYQYMLFCSSCRDFFYPSPDDLKFPSIEEYREQFGIPKNKNLPKSKIDSDYKPYASRKAYLQCQNCGKMITDKERVDAILANKCKWIQVEPSEAQGEVLYKKAKKTKKYYESIGFDINTALAPRVPLQKIAEKEIECRYAPLNIKDELYKKFYVGFWNKIYVSTSKADKVEKSDILLLSNGLGFRRLTAEEKLKTPNRAFAGIAHRDTNAIHIGVDLQKDRLYYLVLGVRFSEELVCDIIEYGELFANEQDMDFKQLEEIINTTFGDVDGKPIGVTSIGIDIRGFSLKDADSRSIKALNFIFDYAREQKEYGVVDWDKFIYPMMGQDKLLEQRYEVQGYKLRPRAKEIVDESGDIEVIKLNDIVFSNKAIKSKVFMMIDRGIKKAKNELNSNVEDRNILYITDYVNADFERRKNLPFEQRRDKHSLEAHLTSEVLGHKLKNGKPTTSEEIYVKKHDSIRNDYLDCLCMAIAQSLVKDTYRTTKKEAFQRDVACINYKEVVKKAL